MLDIRARLMFLMLLVAMPMLVVGVLGLRLLDDSLNERVGEELESIRRIEAARISGGLRNYELYASSLANSPAVADRVNDVLRVKNGLMGDEVAIGNRRVDGLNPFAPRPFDPLLDDLQANAALSGSEVVELAIFAPDGVILGSTGSYAWEPYEDGLVHKVATSGMTAFGNAYRHESGEARLGLMVPIGGSSTVTAVLALEFRLGPLVDLLQAHQSLGRTTEAHLAQTTALGDVEFITPLRFGEDAAFSKTIDGSIDLPTNRALASPGGQLLRAHDYRSVDTITAVQSIPATGWGLVVKIDASEAAQPAENLKRLVWLAGAAVALTIFCGWAFVLRPVGSRLHKASSAAERIADGHYDNRIDDRSTDEIGAMSRTIDRLASELADDIEKRNEAERKLRHRAEHDELTGLYNRQYASNAIETIFADENTTRASVLFLDLDGFKAVNDTYGHEIGDEVLVAVAGRLQSVLDDEATIARWGGDEFVVILPTADSLLASNIADRVQSVFEGPFTSTAGQHSLRCSIGVSTWSPGQTATDILHQADSAMFDEKQQRHGRRGVSPDIVRTVERALAENRLDVWYQPVVSAPDDRPATIIGAEALVRLRDENGELLQPNEFLPQVQDTRLGLAIDEAVMTHALQDLYLWRSTNAVAPDFRLALNLGGAAMRDPAMLTRLSTELHRLDLDAKCIVLEVSEHVAVLNERSLKAMRRMGVKIAVDDFGVQNSNLDRLVDANPSMVKIDRRWLAEVDGESIPIQRSVLPTITLLCRGLGVETVAEGVETMLQLRLLRSYGITKFQGYLFGLPRPADRFLDAWALDGLDRQQLTGSNGG